MALAAATAAVAFPAATQESATAERGEEDVAELLAGVQAATYLDLALNARLTTLDDLGDLVGVHGGGAAHSPTCHKRYPND